MARRRKTSVFIPVDAWLGWAFNQAINSLRFCAGIVFLATRTRTCGEWRNWFKIFQHVVGKRVERAVVYKRAVETETNRVAIRLRAGSATDADASISSADVLNDDRLPQRSSHPLHHNPRDHVGCPAGRERHDHRDRARWIDLRPRNL